jgi:hypothetical protein
VVGLYLVNFLCAENFTACVPPPLQARIVVRPSEAKPEVVREFGIW